jgi:hypothetical protein
MRSVAIPLLPRNCTCAPSPITGRKPPWQRLWNRRRCSRCQAAIAQHDAFERDGQTAFDFSPRREG